MGIEKISAEVVSLTKSVGEVKKAEDVKVQSDEAKELDGVKTDENTQASVEIEDTEPKKEKKGFWSKLKECCKPLFLGENKAGRAIGAYTGALAGFGIGALIGGPIGAIIGGSVLSLAGSYTGYEVQENIKDKNTAEELSNEDKSEKTLDENENAAKEAVV